MRASAMALQLLTVSLASFLAAWLIQLVSATTDWLPENEDPSSTLNTVRLDYFYFLQAAIILVSMIVFIWLAIR